ncbi:Hsp20/alpha crystallin family protein [Paenibacillus sp. OAS669]|uniref:Hsp20/alpha crystallin family protein n=1 Tax=Paenibacillus sp. OAS669 TaxID=2663821 RepID=UPI00178A6E2F|nr:Hsp20/alpha crystallin family protein [Paenibacillus sp. OAS669]MBE1446489.1 HSP20 family molecular chaperone IbpA [Paenibacillus sp. OAS669]
MSRTNNNQSRWEAIESLLGMKLPGLPSDKHLEMWKDTSWVEDYVKQILEKSLPKTSTLKKAANNPSEIFETHHFIIVKMKMADNANPIVKIRTDQVKVDGISGNNPQIIRLPCPIDPRGSRASYKDGILQIKMRKKKIDQTYREISVRYL